MSCSSCGAFFKSAGGAFSQCRIPWCNSAPLYFEILWCFTENTGLMNLGTYFEYFRKKKIPEISLKITLRKEQFTPLLLCSAQQTNKWTLLSAMKRHLYNLPSDHQYTTKDKNPWWWISKFSNCLRLQCLIAPEPLISSLSAHSATLTRGGGRVSWGQF